MKLTDEAIARALGWTCGRDAVGHHCFPESLKGHQNINCRKECPAFTTSLDAIVAEIEARELTWEAGHYGHGFYARVQGGIGKLGSWVNKEKTAPLALCAALLAYLKEQPKGGTE